MGESSTVPVAMGMGGEGPRRGDRLWGAPKGSEELGGLQRGMKGYGGM